MQSYQLHIVSQQLKKRHPYLEPPFKARYDATEVYKAVFDRAIPKLIQILLTDDIAPERYVSALITLNQIASDQTQKSNMLQLGVLGLASAYCHCKVISIRREAALLLGLLLSTNQGLNKMNKQGYTAIQKLLFDQQLQVRNAISWAISRISLSRQGCEILCNPGHELAKHIIQSFLKYSEVQNRQEQYFLIYLLESFKHLFAYDSGIAFALKTGLTKRLKILTSTKSYSEANNTIIHYLSLGSLSNIAMNQNGKQECVDQQVIKQTEHFLQSSNVIEVANEVTLIMFTAIHLIGKKQCIYDQKGQVNTKIIVKLVKLLQLDQSAININQQIKQDIRQTLKIIAQQNDGFLAIADYMSKNTDIKHIEDIFNSQIIIPLAILLPKIKDVAQPPTLPSNKIGDYKAYAKTVNYFLNNEKYEKESIEVALKDCVDLAVKLIMFLCYRGDKILQDGTINSLKKLGQNSQYSKKIMKDFVDQYGENVHKISKTSVKNQLRSCQDLAKIIGVQVQ